MNIIVPPSWIVKLPRRGSFKSSLRKSPKKKPSSKKRSKEKVIISVLAFSSALVLLRHTVHKENQIDFLKTPRVLKMKHFFDDNARRNTLT